jgi:hypothetical protein
VSVETPLRSTSNNFIVEESMGRSHICTSSPIVYTVLVAYQGRMPLSGVISPVAGFYPATVLNPAPKKSSLQDALAVPFFVATGSRVQSCQNLPVRYSFYNESETTLYARRLESLIAFKHFWVSVPDTVELTCVRGRQRRKAASWP